MKMNQIDYDEKNIEINGEVWHIKKLAEEAAELTAAILQWENKGSPFKNIEKEIADVKKAVNYFEMIYGTDNINKYYKDKEKKINRKVRKQIKELKNE